MKVIFEKYNRFEITASLSLNRKTVNFAQYNVSKIRRLSSFLAPQPQSSPKVIVPRQISDTRNPLFPSNLYFIDFLMIERFHLLFSIAGPSGNSFGSNRFNPAQIFRSQHDFSRSSVFFQVLPPLRTWNRHNVIALSQ